MQKELAGVNWQAVDLLVEMMHADVTVRIFVKLSNTCYTAET